MQMQEVRVNNNLEPLKNPLANLSKRMNLNKLQNSNALLFTGMMMLAAGLPVSLFLTSLSQFFIIGSFFIEGSPIEKFKKFSRTPVAILLVVLWLLHLAGLMWTSDMSEGIKDVRIKLPLLILPVVLAGSKPLTTKQFNWILATFVSFVFAGSIISMAVYGGLIERNLQSIRDIFIFNVSHIRFALFICLSIFILVREVEKTFKKKLYGMTAGQIILICWFLFFLIFIESITGIFILLIATILQLILVSFRVSGKMTRAFVLLLAIVIPSIFAYQIRNIVNEYNTKKDYPIDLTAKTKAGNQYIFIEDQNIYESGYPIWVYVCEEELRPRWNKLSSTPYDSLDERGQPLRFTLIRFLSSKGLRKDAEALNSLNAAELKSIEGGIANVKYQDISDTRIRLIQIIWEFDQYLKGYNPSGHSVTQRFEFWKAAMGIIKSNPLIGVGTGDMPQAYKDQYVKMKTELTTQYRLRAHNQYLAIAVGLGIPVLCYFLLFLIYSFFFAGNWKDYLFSSFWFIAVLSMLTEDTLETQSGATFFAFFFCLFLFSKSNFNNSTSN